MPCRNERPHLLANTGIGILFPQQSLPVSRGRLPPDERWRTSIFRKIGCYRDWPDPIHGARWDRENRRIV